MNRLGVGVHDLQVTGKQLERRTAKTETFQLNLSYSMAAMSGWSDLYVKAKNKMDNEVEASGEFLRTSRGQEPEEEQEETRVAEMESLKRCATHFEETERLATDFLLEECAGGLLMKARLALEASKAPDSVKSACTHFSQDELKAADADEKTAEAADGEGVSPADYPSPSPCLVGVGGDDMDES